jgi:hypothetical protein
VTIVEHFAASTSAFEALVGFFAGPDAASLTHAELEMRLKADGFEVLRCVLQDHLDLRAAREERLEGVVGADGVSRGYAEGGHQRPLATIFGQVRVDRVAYRRKKATNLHPADAALNLPEDLHSHGLREMAAVECARGSFEEAKAAIDRAGATSVAKRQVENLARAAAVDFEAYYDQAERPAAAEGEVMVISADGKGIVMRPEGLRAPTAAAAARSRTKLKGRLSKGEKANRKRMAEVGAVYTVTPVPRTPADVMARGDGRSKDAPKAGHKWLTASVADDAASVIARVFDEAGRRDPGGDHEWVALVDGNRHQIDRIHAEAAARASTSPSSSTGSTSWSTCGPRPGASSPKATPRPRTGWGPRPWTCSPARHRSWPPPSAARPPLLASATPSARTPTPAPTTCSPSPPTWTTRPPWPRGGRSARG